MGLVGALRLPTLQHETGFVGRVSVSAPAVFLSAAGWWVRFAYPPYK